MPAGATELQVEGYADATIAGTADYIFNLQVRDGAGSWSTIATQSGSEGVSGGGILKTLTFTSIVTDAGKTYRLGCGVKHSDSSGTAELRLYGGRLLFSVD